MKLIRLAVISIVFLFLAASMIGILLPAHVLVSRAIDVHAPADSIRPLVSDIHQWKKWIDGMQQPSVTVHSSSSADLAGTAVKITAVSDTAIVSSWTGKNNAVQLSTIHLVADTAHRTTIVQWQFEETLKWYPWQRLGSMMNDKILGPMMEKNLNSLKTLAETH